MPRGLSAILLQSLIKRCDPCDRMYLATEFLPATHGNLSQRRKHQSSDWGRFDSFLTPT
jgi:hypothetical protein